MVLLCAAVLLPTRGDPTAAPPVGNVAELLEDEAQGLINKLGSQGGGRGVVEASDVYSGKAAIKIIPMQLFERNIPGWSYRIVEKPAAGEYRYLRFAWRAQGAVKGIMLQMHDEKDWNLRFTAGVDVPNWGTKFVAATPPSRWTVVTRDLFAEFGQRTIKGIALTVFEGDCGYFDHIYLARTIDDLDRIDVTGLCEVFSLPPRLNDDKLDQLWTDLAAEDASKAYLAFWTLAAAPARSTPFVCQNLAFPHSAGAIPQIKIWIAELDADQYAVRERATQHLTQNLEVASEFLKKGLEDASPEARTRILQLLERAADKGARTRSAERINKALRLLKYTNTPGGRAFLDERAHREMDSNTTPRP